MAPHSLLKLLFSLKYIHGIHDLSVVANEIGCSEPGLFIADTELKNLLIAKIGAITRERLQFVCPECLNARVYRDPDTGERVCGSCGTVLEEIPEFDESLPFDTTYALESHLAYDKSLGDTLNGKALMRVLAQSPAQDALLKNGNPDLGLRAKMIKVIANWQDPLPLTRALAKALAYSKAYDMYGDKIFNQDLGRNVRRAYWLTSMIKEPAFTKGLAETVFWLTLCLHKKREQAKAFYKDNSDRVNRGLFTALVELDNFIKHVKEKGEIAYAFSIAKNV